MAQYLLGIDGGGTKTEGILTDACGHILARRVTGASNPNDVTFPVAADRVASLAEHLLVDAALGGGACEVSLFAGIAGVVNQREALADALHRRLDGTAVSAIGVNSDAHILLSAGLADGDGACIICGTGSACFLRLGHRIIRIGGWGYLLDSGGNGYSIGRDAIETALRAHDGRGAPTTLSDRLTAHYGAPVETLISKIYSEGKPYIASCAPCVFAAAEEDSDIAAALILNRNARDLAGYVNAAWAHMMEHCERTEAPLPECLPVVMGGSISQKAVGWVPLVQSLVDAMVPAALTIADTLPVLGALVEAARPVQESISGGVDALRTALRAALHV